MFNLFKQKFTFEKAKSFFPILILSLVLMTALNLYFYKLEVDRSKFNISYNDNLFSELKWKYVNVIIDEEYRAAGIQSKLIAERIDTELKKEYPDLNILKRELDGITDNDIDKKYKKIFRNSITSMYMYNEANDSNDPFIANRDGILMDLSMNENVEGFPRLWDVEIGRHNNPMLATDTVKKILIKSKDIKYWDNRPSFSRNIILQSLNNNLLHLYKCNH